MFRPIDKSNWKRTPYFDHFFNQVKCTFSMNVNLDITTLIRLKKNYGIKLYPILIYSLAKIANNHDEFKTSFNSEGKLGIWEKVHPCYAVFHKDDETFSNIWTAWNEDLRSFVSNFKSDNEKYGKLRGLFTKPDMPENIFTVSCLPWSTFTAFNINVFGEGNYLAPIFTLGKYYGANSRILMPLSIQVHHAVCDGFHVCRFLEELQNFIQNFQAPLIQ